MNKLILASASPRRKELMELAGLDFDIIVADVDEIIPENATPAEVVMSLAEQKADAVAQLHPDWAVIGADTVVSIDGKILGKPTSVENARELLTMLSGKAHKVYTGVAIIKDAKKDVFFEETDVEFYPLTAEEIDSYIATGEPMDKAGAYGIQGKGCTLVKGISGDYFNVVGLPVSRLFRKLIKIN